jgi:hypothetical protein
MCSSYPPCVDTAIDVPKVKDRTAGWCRYWDRLRGCQNLDGARDAVAAVVGVGNERRTRSDSEDDDVATIGCPTPELARLRRPFEGLAGF